MSLISRRPQISVITTPEKASPAVPDFHPSGNSSKEEPAIASLKEDPIIAQAPASSRSISEPEPESPWMRRSRNPSLSSLPAVSGLSSVAEEESKLKDMRERHRECLRKLCDHSALNKNKSGEVQVRLDQLKSQLVTKDHAQELIGGLLQAQQEKITSMREDIISHEMEKLTTQVTVDIHAVVKEEQTSARRAQQESMNHLLNEVQQAHQLTRKAHQDAHEFQLDLTRKKLQASVEENEALEEHAKKLKTQLEASEEKRKKLESASSEMSALHNEVGALKLQEDRAQFEIQERQRSIEMTKENAEQLEIQIGEYAEQCRVTNVELEAVKEESEEQDAEIQELQRELLALEEKRNGNLLELATGKHALVQAKSRANLAQEQVRKVSLELQASEEKRKTLVSEIESMQFALDEASARAEATEKLAIKTSDLLKEELRSAEQQKQRQQAEIEARFQAELQASEQNRRIQQSELEVRKRQTKKANERAKKYKAYAHQAMMKLDAKFLGDAEANLKELDDQDCLFFSANWMASN